MRFFGSKKDTDPVDQTVQALNMLQESLHLLTPAEQARVRESHKYASAEWLDGLALSMRPVQEDSSVHKIKSTMDASKHSEDPVGDEMRTRLTPDSAKLVIVLVGLPARGKSLIGHKLEQFLAWRGYDCRAFRVGSKRRLLDGQNPPESATGAARPNTAAASFFDSKKAYATMMREKVTLEAFDELLEWISTGQIAIFDASNVSIARRAKLQEKVRETSTKLGARVGLVFIETIVTDPEVVREQSLWKVHHSADFADMSEADALADLDARIAHYHKTYETVREAEGAYIKIFNLRAKVQACNVYGRMAKSVLPYLMAIHSIKRPIYLLTVAAGPVPDGDAANGATDKLVEYVRTVELANTLLVLTSTQPRAVATADALAHAAGALEPAQRAQLDPLAGGGVGAARGDETSFHAAFGERVKTVASRLEPLVLEMEACTSPVLLVAHEPSVRVLRTFLTGGGTAASMDAREAAIDTSINFVHGSTLLKLIPKPEGGFEETILTF